MNLTTRLRYTLLLTLTIGLTVLAVITSTTALAQSRPSIASLQAQITALQANNVQGLASYLSIDTSIPARPVARFHDVNVQVVNGLGSTLAVNGLGNLIVGYDEPRSSGSDICSLGAYPDETTCLSNGGVWQLNHKSGSHNVVIGRFHNYSRDSGLVAGGSNTINGSGASVTGGAFNVAASSVASVSGGSSNTASGLYSSVSGGESNTASALSASVAGGIANSASGAYASVSGGENNTASATAATVGGGASRLAEGADDWVAGQLFQDL